MNFLEMLAPVVFGIATRYIFSGAKKVATILDRAPAPLQQAGVLSVAAGVTWASQWVPGLNELVSLADPNLAAGIAAATAFGIHRPSR